MGLKEAHIPTVAQMSQCWTTAIVWPRSRPSWKPLATPSAPWPGVANPKSRTKTFLEEQLRNILAASRGLLKPLTYLMV